MDDIIGDEVVDGLTRVLEKKEAYDKAYAEYDGYSWGYHGHDYIEDLRDAKRDFVNSLRKLIQQTVAASLRPPD